MMTRKEFRQLAEKKIIILDGATGTELIRYGMPGGVCPEQWILEHPDVIQKIQRGYARAGADIIYAPTFGGNRIKLSEFGLGDHVAEVNAKLVAISKAGVQGMPVYIFGDIAPTGKFVEPYGDLLFEDAVAIYKEQIRSLIDAGVDGLIIETMIDLQETRAALIAARELCDFPVMVCLTFEAGQRTLTGNHSVSALLALKALGADAFGCNCSSGPKDMAGIIRTLKPYAEIPLIAKPNAGLPHLHNGVTLFDMGAEEFGSHAKTLVEAGAGIIGGCCGTTPEHIVKLRENAEKLSVPEIKAQITGVISSAQQFRVIQPESPFTLIGERINPTGKKVLKAELKEGKMDYVCQLATEQAEAGAGMLDINVGMSGIDEAAVMRKVVNKVVKMSSLPLCIDTTDPAAAEAALRVYPGRALFNSISAEKDRLEKVLPVVAKYGAMVILLPIVDEGIPETIEERKAAIDKIFSCLKKYGYRKCDIVVDALVMTISSNPAAARLTLDFIRYCSREQGLNTVCGLSNVSFGLPKRNTVNFTFLDMAMGNGLNMAIANPMMPNIVDCIIAGDALNHRDVRLKTLLGNFAGDKAVAAMKPAAKDLTPLEKIKSHLMSGNSEGIVKAVQEALDVGAVPKMIVDDILIPGITEVGDKFETKEFFLPQLVMSAEAMQAGMDVLTPLLRSNESAGDAAKRKKVIVATVRGDIHDIGKNIVALMLGNYNFNVLDLGKNVPPEVILDAAVKENVKLVCLSALMTTTMGQMKIVIEMAKKRGLKDIRFLVGGAVVDAAYAKEIGAEYGEDALATVKIAEKLA